MGHDEPEPSDNIGELFLSQFSRENSQEENDGYEIPIKYPGGPRARQPKKVKSILRSPSPSSAQTTLKTTISSLDRPLRTTRIPLPSTTVTTAVVHTARLSSSDEEIERENPFRKEFLERRPYENIYEELDFDSPKSAGKTPEYSVAQKQRPKSIVEDSQQYTEILPKSSQSNENLTEKTNENKSLGTQSRSTGSLIADRPKQKPPLPPKPKAASIKSPPPIVKHADIMQNEALKTFQKEMLRGDLYEFIHDAETNQVTRIKQATTTIPVVGTTTTKENFPCEEPTTTTTTRLASFNPTSPLPPIPKSNIPSYSKVYKRTTSVDRPTVSPPPPPINLSTLPSADKLKTIQIEDGSNVEILPVDTLTPVRVTDEHHENCPEYNLVTEQTHREILLQENEIRNALQEQKIITETVVSTSRIPVRKAPLPPTATKELLIQKPCEIACALSSNNINQEHSFQQSQSTSNQVFPVTQILPVQYSQLPIPQQPDYFLTFPSSNQMTCNPISIPQSNAFSTFMVSDNHGMAQTKNNSSNVMSHDQQQSQYIPNLPSATYLQPTFISLPISHIQTMNQQQHHLQGSNYVNIHASPILAQNTVINNSNNNNSNHGNNPNYIFDVYRSNYNQSLLQQQQNYHYQAQPLLHCQQDAHSLNRIEQQNVNNDNNDVGGVASYSSFTIVDSQFKKEILENNTEYPGSHRTEPLNSSANTENYYDIPEGIESSDEPTFQTFGKQTDV